MSVLENIVENVTNANSILILTHQNPDGDAIGSSLGLHNALKKMGKKSTVYIPIPDKLFSFLPSFDEIITGDSPEFKSSDFDLCVSLDASDEARLGNTIHFFHEIENTICVDHHITNQNFADINYINAVASSTCENLMVVLASLGIAINKDIAECLYTGILTDTGAFRYNTKSETYSVVATLMDTGLNSAKIYRTLFDVTTLSKTKVAGRCIDRLELVEDGKVGITYSLVKDLEELNIEESDLDGIVNIMRNIDSVEVSLFIKERPDGTYKISMRANEYVDVSVIASKFGGGGHVRAAGFETSMNMEQLKDALVEEIKKQLK